MVAGCLSAYELHAASPALGQIAVPLMSYSLSFAVCICFASTETLNTVGFLDTVPMSGSDCYGIRTPRLPCSLSLNCCLKVCFLHTLDSDSDRVAWCRYVLSNIESKRGIRKGDRIWQIAFGSGFKCNSAVWRSMRNNNQQHTAWDDTPKPVEP